jgi:CCCH-type zinc finger/Zinc finger C-x8-C-x5-C-x3-H type (and similar)/RNA-binding, Nab2-type zinc finger
MPRVCSSQSARFATVRNRGYRPMTEAGSGKVCIYFLKNACTWGEACRHLHQDGSSLGLENTVSSSSGTPCPHFLRGTCRLGDHCRDSHSNNDSNAVEHSWANGSNAWDSNESDPWNVPMGPDGWPMSPSHRRSTASPKPSQDFRSKECKYFAQGNCTWGDSCSFRHDTQTDSWHSTIPDKESVPLESYRTPDDSNAENWIGFEVVPNNHVLSEPCQFHNRGNCHRADACPFLHDNTERTIPAVEEDTPLHPCHLYAEGKCARGEACPFLHQATMEENSIPVIPDSEICQFHKAGKCTRGVACPFLHEPTEIDSSILASHESATPCQFFGRGKCARGDQCPFPHVIAETPVPNNSLSSGLRTGFTLGTCTGRDAGGLTYSFREINAFAEIIASSDHSFPLTENLVRGRDDKIRLTSHHGNTTAREPCKYFSQGKCFRGNECHFLHTSAHNEVVENVQSVFDAQVHDFRSRTMACKFFRLGECRNGETCVYSHIITDDQDGEQQVADTWGPQMLSPSESSTPCKYFQAGYCKRGNTCFFSHAAGGGQLTTAPDSLGDQEVCLHLLTVVCTYGQLQQVSQDHGWGTRDTPASFSETTTLSKERLCKFFPQGKCKQGDACPFQHIHEEARACEAQTADPRPTENWTQNTRVCKFFAQGHCKKGAACSFTHDSTDDQPLRTGPSDWTLAEEPDPTSKICEFFEQGNCTEGDGCQFRHEKPMDPWSSWGYDEVCGDSNLLLMQTLIFDRRSLAAIGLAMMFPELRMMAIRLRPLNHFGNRMTPGIPSSPLRRHGLPKHGLSTYGRQKIGGNKSAFANFSLKGTAEKEQLVLSHMILRKTSISELVLMVGHWQKNPPRIQRSVNLIDKGIAQRVMRAGFATRSQWIHGLRGVTMRFVVMVILGRCHTPSCPIAGASQ